MRCSSGRYFSGARGRGFEPRLGTPKDPVLPVTPPPTPPDDSAERGRRRSLCDPREAPQGALLPSHPAMGSLIKKRRKRMRKKKHKKLLKKTRWQRRQQGK